MSAFFSQDVNTLVKDFNLELSSISESGDACVFTANGALEKDAKVKSIFYTEDYNLGAQLLQLLVSFVGSTRSIQLFLNFINTQYGHK